MCRPLTHSKLAGIAFVIGWVGVTMIPFFYILKVIGWFRVHEVDEDIGMDLSHHGASTYTFEKPDQDVIAKFEERREEKIEKKGSRSSAKKSTNIDSIAEEKV